MTTHSKGLIVVAGSGASGLVAALAAAVAGAAVLVVERAEELGGTTALGGGRVWVPANHCPENAGDSAEAARAYLGGLFPARYAHLTEAFVANAPAMARFVEERSPHRFAACPAYPDYHPERAGATAGGRCLDIELADLSAIATSLPAWNNRTILAVFRKLWISALPAAGNSIPSAPRSTTTACRPSARRRTRRA